MCKVPLVPSFENKTGKLLAALRAAIHLLKIEEKIECKGTNLSFVRVLTWPVARKAMGHVPKGHGPVVITTL